MKFALESLARRYGLIAIYAFGSQAKEAAACAAGATQPRLSQDSDVDIGVLPERNLRLSAAERVGLMQNLEKVFSVARVDLVILTEASPFLSLEVVRGELLFATDLDAEAEYQLYVLRRAGDLADWEIERRRLLLIGEAI